MMSEKEIVSDINVGKKKLRVYVGLGRFIMNKTGKVVLRARGKLISKALVVAYLLNSNLGSQISAINTKMEKFDVQRDNRTITKLVPSVEVVLERPRNV